MKSVSSEKNAQEMSEFTKTVIAGIVSFSSIFVILAFLCFLPSFMEDIQFNKGFTKGNCTYEPGYVFQTTCGTPVWKSDCWYGMVGLSAIRNVTSYIPFGPYKIPYDAERVISYNVSSNFGICYYKDGGYIITISLRSPDRPLIAFIVLLATGVAILFVGLIPVLLLIRKRMKYDRFLNEKPEDLI